jgi:leucyl/phenylalanyl-tRNA--protein transferase
VVAGPARRAADRRAEGQPVAAPVLPTFEIRVDTAFDDVVAACADSRRPGRWITPRIAEAYRGCTTWAGPTRWSAGGRAGWSVACTGGVGGLFAGESMFHRETDASKVALVALVGCWPRTATRAGCDVQWRTDHLASLGVVEISRDEYRAPVAVALTAPARRASDPD